MVPCMTSRLPSMTNTDFDWLAGSWTSPQRRLAKVLAGCGEGDEFDATPGCPGHLDRNGTLHVLRPPDRGIEGMTLRLYSPQEKVWRIWWASAASDGQLDVPVVGAFDGTVGSFECDDTFQRDGTSESTPIRVRYRWSHVDTAQPR